MLLAEKARFRALGPRHLADIAQEYGISAEHRDAIEVHASVLPFRTNAYVLGELIDWSDVPDDPIFQLVFPQPGMLRPEHHELARRLRDDAAPAQRAKGIAGIRAALNPHPSGQRELNVPSVSEGPLPGLQHKYAQTVLYFPAHGQTCHAYCTYCFRWAQFVGDADLKFAAPSPTALVAYLHAHPQVTDVLVTGGDPMIMVTERLESHIETLLAVPTVRTIRFGTKAPAYWPQRFVSDADADDLLRLFERIIAAGKSVAVMAHYSHDRELSTDIARAAIARIRGTGAVVYCQAPIMRRINDDPGTWRRMWSDQLGLGAVPYYMFMARDTGPRAYFEVPIARAVDIFAEAVRQLPGLARTVRGPVMSTTPGKILIDGSLSTGGSRVFSARFVQARDAGLTGRPFLLEHSDTAVWADELRAAPGTQEDIVQALATVGREDEG